MSDKITIYINDKEIASGTLTVVATRKTFSAIYEGRKIDAECSTSNDGGIQTGHKCVIYIDGKKTDELSF